MDIDTKSVVGNPVYQDKIDGASIRLLCFSSAHDGGFTGNLKVFQLSDAPSFYSASYTWGDKTYSDTTIRLRAGSLPVLNSLEPFLRMVSEHDDFDDSQYWWIDSLCINLADRHEREQQVRIMANVYQRAKRAIVWLGEEEEEGSDCTGAIAFLHYLSNVQATIGNPAARENLRGGHFAMEWLAVGNLLARPWWTRVWTLQEFILPREAKLCCGGNLISRGKFKSAMYSIFLCSTGGRDMERELIPRPAFDAAFNRRRIHQWYTNPQSRGMSLVAIMAYLGNHLASDSRDRIYSVLGLITERDRRLVGNPEYTSNVQQLYAKLVRSFWTEYHNLDIICFSHLFNRYSSSEDSGLETAVPSFTPDWRVHSDSASPVPLMASQSASPHIGNFRPLHSRKWKVSYDAPGQQLSQRANIRFHDNLKEVWCDGVILDTIDTLGSLEGCEPRCKSFVCAGEEPVHGIIHSPDRRIQTPPVDFLDVLEAIARSLVLNRQDKYLRFQAPQHYVSDFLVLCHACVSDDTRASIDPTFATWFQQNHPLRLGNQTLESLIITITSFTDPAYFESLPPPTLRPESIQTYPPNTSPDAESDQADTFLTRFQDTIKKKSRRLMVTGEGNVGMAPCRARRGDKVVMLFGCSIPLVLRRVSVREAWQVIGEAYVHGFMNGEVQHLVRRGTRTVQRFRLV